ncbi:HAD family hydrolase [Nocardia fluminea]|uniref:HAD family hydrolase n=1 Tax=Nocardia fluminea TaxID=134984 RepID=UPI00381D0A02
MPPSLNTQTIVAFIWDFDKTLAPGYMQDPLFEEFGIDAKIFWSEVNGLVDYYKSRDLSVSKDTAYLGHILGYVRDGHFSGLTNAKLRELGARVPLAPGMPEFMKGTHTFVANEERYRHHEIKVEHYIVSTGLRQMIEGNPIRKHVDGVWACELLPNSPSRGYLDLTQEDSSEDAGILTGIGYTLDNTTKTRAVFEINKGVNFEPGIDVNAQMSPDDRRVPFGNMIYIADGPSDVPVFSVVNQNGGKTLGVYTGGFDAGNYAGVQQLLHDGRINLSAQADYRQGTEAYNWLMHSLKQISDGICASRESSIASILAPAGHKI